MPTQFTLDGPDGRKMTFRAWSSVDSVIFQGGHGRKKGRRQNTSDLASHNRHRMSGVRLESNADSSCEPEVRAGLQHREYDRQHLPGCRYERLLRAHLRALSLVIPGDGRVTVLDV